MQFNSPSEEYFPIVDENGTLTGKASRKECHSGTFLLHPVIHLHVFNSQNQLYLQKRAMTKDIQPGKWDTSVGGHVDYGEDVISALVREAGEELGIQKFRYEFLARYKFTSKHESELVNTFYTFYDGDIQPDPSEITEGRFWTMAEIRDGIGKEVFTPNFESEFEKHIQPRFEEIVNRKSLF